MEFKYLFKNEVEGIVLKNKLPSGCQSGSLLGLVLILDSFLISDQIKIDTPDLNVNSLIENLENASNAGYIFIGELTASALNKFFNDEEIFDEFINKREDPYFLGNLIIANEELFWDSSIIEQLKESKS